MWVQYIRSQSSVHPLGLQQPALKYKWSAVNWLGWVAHATCILDHLNLSLYIIFRILACYLYQKHLHVTSRPERDSWDFNIHSVNLVAWNITMNCWIHSSMPRQRSFSPECYSAPVQHNRAVPTVQPLLQFSLLPDSCGLNKPELAVASYTTIQKLNTIVITNFSFPSGCLTFSHICYWAECHKSIW